MVADLYKLVTLKLKPDDLMVKFHNALPDTESLLDGIQIGEYLCHPREVAALKDILPHSEKELFVCCDLQLPGNAYEKLKAFLRQRKDKIQKLDRHGTKVNPDLVDYKDDKPRNGCLRCREGPHQIRDCLVPPKKQGGKEKKGATNSAQRIQTNSCRPASCRRCLKAGGTGRPCPRCPRTGTELKHCLGHCPRLTMTDVEG